MDDDYKSPRRYPGRQLLAKIGSWARQARFWWLQFWTLSRADRRERAKMNAYYRENPKAFKWTAPIGWPFEIVQDPDGEYWYLPANGGRRRPPRWMLLWHHRRMGEIDELIRRM